MQVDQNTYKATSRGRMSLLAIVAIVAGLALTGIGYLMHGGTEEFAKQFYHSYLVAFGFWVSMALGTLFFTMLQHLTNAKWSIVVRRISENLTAPLPFMFLLFIPMLFGLHELYHWSHEDAVLHDPLLQWKEPYLNTTFFTIRTVVYFLLWSALAYFLRRLSLQQDENPEQDFTHRMKVASAIGMLVFALSISGAAFDWYMSLDPHWYSTIFGVYFFAGGFLGSLALMVLIAMYMRRSGGLGNAITVEHLHDLGKLCFGFVIFWAYVAYSQYFLQWYGNIPEETVWYLHRWDGTDGTATWWWVSMLLLFGHFFGPFFILVFRFVKRSVPLMSLMSVWLILMHWVDTYWLVMPNLHHHAPHFTLLDLGLTVAMGGVFFWLFWNSYTSKALVPIGDPRLQESIRFVNV